jgi:hypothetical protein
VPAQPQCGGEIGRGCVFGARRCPGALSSAELAEALGYTDKTGPPDPTLVWKRYGHLYPGLPVAWQVETAKANESTTVAPLLDALAARGFKPETCSMDRGYDVERVYAECAERGVLPIMPLRQTPAVKRGEHGAPTCEHGRGRSLVPTSSATRPSGAARPASVSPSPRG